MKLVIADHLSWEAGLAESHLLLLQEKINTYLRFIESGELVQRFPDAADRAPVIVVVAKFRPSGAASIFYKNAAAALEEAGYALRIEVRDEEGPRQN